MRGRFLAVAILAGVLALAPTPGLGASRHAEHSVMTPVSVITAMTVPATVAPGTAIVSLPTSLDLAVDIAVAVPVTVVCNDTPGATPSQDTVSVVIEEAHGNAISHGLSSTSGGPIFGTSSLLTCDGTTVNKFNMDVLADTSGSPFKAGAAIGQASISRFESTGSLTGSSGPQVVELKG